MRCATTQLRQRQRQRERAWTFDLLAILSLWGPEFEFWSLATWHVSTADCALHFKLPSIPQHDKAREIVAKQLIHSPTIVEDDEAKASMVVWRARIWVAIGAVPLQPGFFHAPKFTEDCIEVILAHVLRNAAHEDLPDL